MNSSHPLRRRSRQVSAAEPSVDLTLPQAPARSAHEVTVVDGRFTVATCSCGWTGLARRHRAAARAEAHDHALLYADGSGLDARTDLPLEHEQADSGQDPVPVDLRPAPTV